MTIEILPCLDSDVMAIARKKELDISKDTALKLGLSAIEAAHLGFYITQDGHKVEWSEQVKNACNLKISIPPNQNLRYFRNMPTLNTKIQITNETTLGASQRLIKAGLHPLALNLANGIQPGGGFMYGAKAQEESICRCSALFPTLLGDKMYEEHQKRPLPDSTDWAILSPKVPVFRSDNGAELLNPWLLDFITCAAPFAPTVGQPLSRNLLKVRIHRLFAIAKSYEYSTLVLGAWGCGAFKNNTQDTAIDFLDILTNDYSNTFSHIIFAIADWSPERKFLGPFRDTFSTN